MRRQPLTAARLTVGPPQGPMPAMRVDYEATPPYPSVRVLRALHITAAAVHVLWVGLAVSCLTSTEVATPVWMQRITYAAASDGTYIQFGPRETVFKFYPMRTLIGFVAVTAVAHIFYATLRGAGAAGNPWRWAEYAVTATMLTLNAAVGVGASSLDAFVFVLALSVAMQATGLGLDLVHGGPRTRVRELLLAIGFLCVTALVVVLSQHAHTAAGVLVDEQRVASAYGIFYLSFGVVGALRAYDVGPFRGAAFTEMTYALLSLSCKTSMFWLSFGGVRQMLEHLRPEEARNGVDWALVQTLAAAVPGSLAAAAILAAMAYAPPPPAVQAPWFPVEEGSKI